MDENIKVTQEERVLRWLRERGSITSLEAFREFGITRLSGRIFNLRKSGYEIVSERETTKNRYGENVSFAKYILQE